MLNAAVDRNDPRHGSEGGLPAEEAAALLKVASDAAREWSDPEVLAATAEQQGFGEGAPTLGTDPCFEALIDHPSWIDRVQHFLGGEGSFGKCSSLCVFFRSLKPLLADNSWGPCFIDECFAQLRVRRVSSF